MLRTHKSLLAAALVAAVFTTAAVSAGPWFGPSGAAPFAAMDADGDGFVTEAEYLQHRGARQAARAAQGRMLRHAAQAPAFSAWDSDGDGRMTPQELAAGRQARWGRWGGGPYSWSSRPCWRW